MPPEPIRILPIQVTGANPVVHKCLSTGLRPLPVARGGTTAANPEIADFALRHLISFMVQQTGVIPAQQRSTTAVTQISLVVRHEHVQHLSRTNSVQNRNAESLLPVFS